MMITKTTREGGLLCVAIGFADHDKVIAAARAVENMADVIEIRLDALRDPAVAPFAENLRRPLLFTCRPEWEGGQYSGGEKERVDLLGEAIRHGGAYVDLEVAAPDESHQHLNQLRGEGSTRLILSHHYFDHTPPGHVLREMLSRMQNRGADIGKIVTTAKSYHDVLRVLQLQEIAAENDFPLIAFCMGKHGVISRVATTELGGYMTYCAFDEADCTAPGQIPVKTMREVQQLLGFARSGREAGGSSDEGN